MKVDKELTCRSESVGEANDAAARRLTSGSSMLVDNIVAMFLTRVDCQLSDLRGRDLSTASFLCTFRAVGSFTYPTAQTCGVLDIIGRHSVNLEL
jgi:hypothetical protein